MSALLSAWQTIVDRPFAELEAFILRAVAEGDGPQLLPHLADLPDREPLATAVRALCVGAELPEAELGDALATLDAAGLARVLESAPERGELLRIAVDLLHALPQVPSADAWARAAFLLRWIQRRDPAQGEALRAQAVATARAALAERAPERLTDLDLLCLPGGALEDLAAEAWAVGCQARWQDRREAFAQTVLTGLATQRKSLSLARAETLLSSRVYTDPTHCLIELLQNAEDTGARHWRVQITSDAVWVWHDGTPFDARDVVGVLSIGQTTKTQSQIGLFGVGFKSVYAICERPQIHSDVWQFEVADVSLPRRLATRPPDAPGEGTLVVLPLRTPDDPRAGALALAERAHALSAHVLLTLRNIESIQIDALETQRMIQRTAGGEPDVVCLHVDGAERRFRQAERYREPTRLPDDDVRVLLPLDARGRAQPLPTNTPQVHCYLPTTLQPGLRFLLHARFVLPVDRERIDTADPRNQAALRRAGRLLAQMVGDRLEAGRDAGDLIAAAPLESELPADWQPLRDAFAARAADQHWVRTLTDLRVRPREVRIVPDVAVARALAGHPSAHLAVIADNRLRAHALAQGARLLDGEGVRELLADAVGTLADGSRAPRWLDGGLRVVLRFALQVHANLDGVPIWPDADGRLYRVVQRADRILRPLAGPQRAILSPVFADDPHLAEWVAELPALTSDDVLSDLRDHSATICADAGVGRVLRWLSGRAESDLMALRGVPLCPDEAGRLRAATAIWRAPDNALGMWMASLRTRPPLLDPGLAERYEAVFDRLGVQVLDLPALLVAHARGDAQIEDRDLDRLHMVLADTTELRSPRANRALADAAIWPDEAGVRRRLTGRDAARVPTHPALRTLAPAVPWLRTDLARAEHVTRLEVRTVTPVVLARALIQPDPQLPVADIDAALGFLAQVAQVLAPSLCNDLAEASLWRDTKGERRALAALRAVAVDARIAAVYAAWGDRALIDPAARQVAEALGQTVVVPDAAQLLRDLDIASARSLQNLPQKPLLLALARAGEVLPPSRLTPALDLPIYPLADGGVARLGSWDAPDNQGAHRVPGELVEALDWTGRLRIDADAETLLLPLLEALSLRPAGFEDVVHALAEGAPMPAAVDAIRAAVVRMRDALPTQLDLSGLAIWPNQTGAYRPATALIRPSTLADPVVAEILDPAPDALLDPVVAIDADALGDQVAFRDVTDLVIARVEAAALDAEPLDAQVPWLNSIGGVLRVLTRIAAGAPTHVLTRLPLVVDALGRLSTGPRLDASHDEIATVIRTPFVDRLAHPAWAVGARDVAPDLAPRMSARLWLEALATHASEPVPIEGHPTFVEPDARAALYRALLARMDVIAGDANARAALGRAAVLPTAEGMLRPATSLLFDPNLPDLDLSWNPTDEVPEALRTWLRGIFSLDRKRLRTMLDYVVDGLHAAAEDGAGERVAALLAFVARTLRIEVGRPQFNAEQAARFKLRKRLKAETTTGAFVRPKALLAPTESGLAETLDTFMREPPLFARGDYPPVVLALLRAAGAEAHLNADALDEVLAHPGEVLRDGDLARAAFARLVAHRAAADGRLVHALELPKRRFVPDGRGRIRAPGEMYWPTPAVIALLGDRPQDAPHPAFAHELPEAAWRAVGFRDAADARIDDVLARLPAGACLDEVVLRWLDDQLDAHRLTAAEVRDALGGRPVFLTDDDRHHPPETLIRDLPPDEFGRRRGGWSAGRTLPRLTAALRIPNGPAPGHYAALLDEIGTAFIAQGVGLLSAEPELEDVIPRAWARLLAADAAPDRGILVAEGAYGPILAWSTEPTLVWPTPPALMHAAHAAGVDVCAPRVGEADPTQLGRWLRSRGMPTIGALWVPERNGVRAHHTAPVDSQWLRSIAALWSILPTVWQWRAKWAPEPGQPPATALAARSLTRSGRVLGEALLWPAGAALQGDALVLTADADGYAIADAICRDRLVVEAPTPPTVQLIADLLACVNPQSMRLLLDARLEVAAQQAPPRPVRRERPPERHTLHGAPRPAPTPEAPPPEAPKAPASDDSGLFGRLKRWLTKPDERPEPPAAKPPAAEPPAAEPPPETSAREPAQAQPALPPAAPRPGASNRGASAAPPGRRDHAGFFRPRGSVAPQLNDAQDWLADRSQPAVYGFALTPRRLPTPFLYGPQLIADRFDRRTQHWTAERIDPSWRSAPEGRHRVAFAGRLPPGESVLPLPLYGRLVSVDADPPAVVVRTAGDLPLVSVQTETTIRYEVALGAAPDFSNAHDAAAPPTLTQPTVPDAELPAECHALVDRVIGLGPLDRVLAIRDFVRASYRYDPSRFEDPRLADWLRRISRGRANAQLAALHAARDGRHLGAGVCYELNVLVVELLRRAAVPAAVATGWVFERGQVDEPDHLWALALLGTEAGARWMPIDAASTRDGRPLRVRPRSAARWRKLLPERATRAPKAAAWSSRKPRVDGVPLPLSDLVRVARHVEAFTGADMPDEGELRARCRALLADPETARRLAELLNTEH